MTLTILTPTYNRAYILSQAYHSLCEQTCFDFEWIIVDDGSTDNTKLLVESWCGQEHSFPIVYITQENGGKHRAVNRGLRNAKGEYTLILDSDDFLTTDAVATAQAWIESISGLSGYAAVVGLKGWKSSDSAIGGTPKSEYIDATYTQRIRYKLHGDKADIYKTALLREYPFPEFEGENFLRESAVWDRIALQGYKLRWFNKIIYKCEYLEDGLTKANEFDRALANFQGYTYCAQLAVQVLPFLYKELRIGIYDHVAAHKGKDSSDVCRTLNISRFHLLLGRLVYRVHKALRR